MKVYLTWALCVALVGNTFIAAMVADAYVAYLHAEAAAILQEQSK